MSSELGVRVGFAQGVEVLAQARPGDVGRRPDRHLAVAVLADHERVDAPGVDPEIDRQEESEPGRVEDRAGPEDLARRQARWRAGRHSVRTSTGFEAITKIADGAIAADPRRDVAHDRGIAPGEVQASLTRPLPGAGRHDDDAGALDIRPVAGADPRRSLERHGVAEVHGLALGPRPIGVDQHDLRGQTGSDQGVGERGPDIAGADDHDLGGPGSIHPVRVVVT